MKFKRQAMRMALPYTLAAIVLWLFTPQVSHALPNIFKKNTKPTQLQNSTDDYLKRVHGLESEPPRTMGSLWFPAAPMTETASDYKARHTGDLLMIRVVDNFSATANGTGSQQRSFNASSGISAFVGTIGATQQFAKFIFSHLGGNSERQGSFLAGFHIVLEFCGPSCGGASQRRAGCGGCA